MHENVKFGTAIAHIIVPVYYILGFLDVILYGESTKDYIVSNERVIGEERERM
jgi:hypothetical protein